MTTYYAGLHYEVRVAGGQDQAGLRYRLGDRLVALRLADGRLQYVHGDALGSTLALTDAAGEVVGGNQVRYDAYGRPRSGSVSSLAADEAYTGQKRDATGLYAFPARVYDPYLNQWIQPDPIVPDPGNPQDLNRYAYCRNNPLKLVDPSGHWSEEALEASLGKDWRESYFGKGAVFEGRDKLLAFLTSDKTTSDFILGQVQSFFQGAGVLHGLGADLSNFDAMGMRLSGSVGGAASASVSGDAILNLSSGEFSFFGSPEAGLLLGDSVQVIGGFTLIKGMPSNNAYRGAFWAGGGLAGAYGSVTGEFFWGAPMSDRFSPTDTAHGGFVGGGAAVPELGVYGSLSYSLEVYREDAGGGHWYSPLPQLRQMIGDLQQVIYHDVEMNPIWPWSPYR